MRLPQVRIRQDTLPQGRTSRPRAHLHLDGINKLLDTKFTPEDMEYIYTNLGNGINHELCMKFVKSGYDLKVIEESV